MIGDIAIYDPSRLSEADFLAGFVARLDIYEFLLRQFHSLGYNEVATHRLIVGQRGMGKTTLLRRLSIGIEQDPALRERFAGLTFREEQYDVASLAQLWRNCAEALAEWLEARGRNGEAAEIDRKLARDRLADPDAAFAQFAEMSAGLGRRPVLFLDNINLILGALSESEGWKLRKILQARGGPIVFAASAAFLEESVNPKAPFYEFFHVHTLDPLDVGQMRTCLARIAERRGEQGKRAAAILAAAPERVPVLHTLTGGNPRTLAFIYRLLESERESDAQKDLENLLDDVTGLYKARVEELPEQARKVFDAIALNWDPAATATLVETTMLEPTTLSPQLNRLVERGFVEKTERADGKSGWQVAERFFNIWYLMRHGNRRVRQRLRWLTSFLTNFYSRDELVRMGRDLAARVVGSPTEARYFLAVSGAIDDHFLKRALTKRASTSLLTLDRTEIEKIAPMDDLDEDSRELDATGRAIRDARPWPTEQADEFFRLMRLCGRSRAEQQRTIAQLASMPQIVLDTVLKSMRRLIEIRSENQFPPEVTEAVEGAILSGALRDFGDTANAETAAAMAERPEIGRLILLWAALSNNDKGFIGRHAASIEAAIESCRLQRGVGATFHLGALLHIFLGQPSKAEKYYRQAIGANRSVAPLWAFLGDLLQINLARYDEAEAAYREAIRIDPSSSIAWNGLGNHLKDRLAQYVEAEDAYRRAISIDPACAVAWSNLGNLLQVPLARYSEAEAAYREAIRIDPTLFQAWTGLGSLLSERLARYTEGEAAYREAVRLNPAHAPSWAKIGILLAQRLARYDEAETSLREAIRIDPATAVYWVVLGYLLANYLDRYGEAEAAYRSAIRSDPTSTISWVALSALMANQLARYEEAEAACEQAIQIDPGAGGAWLQLGDLQADHRHDFAAAREAYEKAEKAGKVPEAQLSLIWLELSEGHLEAAHKLRMSIASRLSTGEPPSPQQLRLVDSGIALAAGQRDEAFEHFDALYREGGVSPEYFDEFFRLLRIFAKYGAGKRLLARLDDTDLGEKIAPVRAAFDAYLHDERKLLNINPETRGAAERMYRWLASNRPREQGQLWPGPGTSELDSSKKPSKGRGRARD